MNAITLIAGMLLVAHGTAHARLITLVATDQRPSVELAIGPNESLVLVCSAGESTTNMIAVIDGHPFRLYGDIGGENIRLAGPLTFWLHKAERVSMATVEVQPNDNPATALVVSRGDIATVSLQCSTNLVDWVEAQPGRHTNTSANCYFRIQARKAL